MSPLQLFRIDGDPPTPVQWLWPGYVPAGKLTLLDGDPDLGKSLIAVDLAARLSRGGALPDGAASSGIVRSLFLQAEDDAGDTLRPRLEAANADLENVFVLGRDGPQSCTVQLPRHVRRLEKLIREGRVGLVVIDPLIAFLPQEICMTRDQSVRKALARLAKLAARTGAAIIMVRHLNKQGQQKALYRGGGSIGIIGSARSALLLAQHPTEDLQLLTVTKSNLTQKPATLGYRVIQNEAKQPIVEWTGAIPLRADEVLNPRPIEEPELLGVTHAAAWLMEALSKGPRPAVEMVEAAKAAGISERTLERAKDDARVASKLIYEKDKPKRWVWRLRKNFLPIPDDLD